MDQTKNSSQRDREWLPLIALTAGLGLFYKMLITHWLVLGEYIRLSAILADAAFLTAIVLLLWLIPRPMMRATVLCVLDVALSVFFVAATVFTDYFGRMLSLSMISMVGQVDRIVGGSILNLIGPIHLLYAVDLVPLLVFTVLAWRDRKSEPRKREGKRGIGRFVVVTAIASVVIVAGWSTTARAAASVDSPASGQAVAASYGLFAFQYASVFGVENDLIASNASVDLADPVDVQQAIDEALGVATGELRSDIEPGDLAGRSVIIVQLESVQSMVMGVSVEGRELTPVLNSLAQETWYFPNAVQQTGVGNTSDAEFVVNTSLFPPAYLAASSGPAIQKVVPALPRVLTDEGYNTVTMHANDVTFWNRDALYPALGFTRYLDKEFFGEEDVIGYGASDEVLYRKAIEEMVSLREEGTPFYAHLIAVTSHHPFRPLPEYKEPFVPGGPFVDTITGAYISHMEYADRALGSLIDGLKSTGLYDECILVIYGDHAGLRFIAEGGDEGVSQEALLGRPYTQVDRLLVPLIIHVPGGHEPMIVQEAVAQSDIMPTVLDLLGLASDSPPHFGQSLLFDDAAPRIIPVFGTVVIGSYFNDSAFMILNELAGEVDVMSIDDPLSVETFSADAYPGVAEARYMIELSDGYVRGLPDIVEE